MGGLQRGRRETASLFRQWSQALEPLVSRTATGGILHVDRDLHTPVLLPTGVRAVGGDRLRLAAARRGDPGAIDPPRRDVIRRRRRASVGPTISLLVLGYFARLAAKVRKWSRAAVMS